jgi:hypothetical protein
MSGCGQGQFMGATLTPTPTPTSPATSTPEPTATSTSTPIPGPMGHWSGSDNGSILNPDEIGWDVSFDVGEDGNIHDFKFDLTKFPSSTLCSLEADEIIVQTDRTFTLTMSDVLTPIRGKFESNNSIIGTWGLDIAFYCTLPPFTDLDGEWIAEWVSP